MKVRNTVGLETERPAKMRGRVPELSADRRKVGRFRDTGGRRP